VVRETLLNVRCYEFPEKETEAVRSQNEAEEAMALPETNLLTFFAGVL